VFQSLFVDEVWAAPLLPFFESESPEAFFEVGLGFGVPHAEGLELAGFAGDAAEFVFGFLDGQGIGLAAADGGVDQTDVQGVEVGVVFERSFGDGLIVEPVGLGTEDRVDGAGLVALSGGAFDAAAGGECQHEGGGDDHDWGQTNVHGVSIGSRTSWLE